MNDILKLFLSLSLSGSLLILLFLSGGVFLKNRTSRRWQYYLWLVVIARLLLPITPEASLMGTLFRQTEQAVLSGVSEPGPAPAAHAGPAPETAPEPGGPEQKSDSAPAPGAVIAAAAQYLWLVWLGAALILLIRKITAYQGFVQYVRAGCAEVSDVVLLDKLARTGAQIGVRRPVELWTNRLVSSPMLLGFFRPCIVLPTADLPEADFEYTIRHELTHCKQGDMFYKWLVQLTICVHWFNPLVRRMGREIDRACELACDEAVIRTLDGPGRRAYGDTLLHAMEAGGGCGNSLASVPLNESAELLKERLGAIMKFQKQSKGIRLLTGALTLCVILGAVFAGAYPASAANAPGRSAAVPAAGQVSRPPVPSARPRETGGDADSRIDRYYAAGSLPLFQTAFSRLDESAQTKWLETLYDGGDFAFFSAAVRELDEGSSLLDAFAERAYADEEMAFFSALTDCMDSAELELWLDRALEDGDWAVQSMLFNKLDRDDEFDKLEEEKNREWAEAQAAEYRAAGVIMNGKDYYYKGQLVNVFLDLRPNKSFYTLSLNPEGTVNIKIVRNAGSQITGVSPMTEAEVTELLEDMDDGEWDDGERQETHEGRIWHPQVIPVSLEAMADEEIIWLGEYPLSDGDRIWYSVSAETGNGLQVGFAKPGDTALNTTYYSVKNLRQKGEPLECVSSFTFAPPAKPGTYRLFLRAPDGPLGNVTGHISLASPDMS